MGEKYSTVMLNSHRLTVKVVRGSMNISHKKIELEAIASKTILRENPDNEIKDATSKPELYDRLSIYFADIRKEVR